MLESRRIISIQAVDLSFKDNSHFIRVFHVQFARLLLPVKFICSVLLHEWMRTAPAVLETADFLKDHKRDGDGNCAR